MQNKLPGILFLLSMPLAILIFIAVSSALGSDILALFAALGFYAAVALAIAFWQNKRSK